MKKYLIFGLLICFFPSCEKNSYNPDVFLMARIVGFDMNCSTCILEFPDDDARVREVIGKSTANYYEALNMNSFDFTIGQTLKVRIRKAETSDLRPCITLYPSLDYKNVVITTFADINSVSLNDTNNLAWHNCLIGFEDIAEFCFDSVLNDSRCPLGAECFWAGNATVQFSIKKYDSDPVLLRLNTTLLPRDTTIYGYNFSLVGLTPYPSIGTEVKPEDYIARIIIKK